MSSYGSPNSGSSSGPFGSQGQRFMMQEDDAQLTRDEQRRVPSLARWVCDRLRQCDDWELPFDDVVEELQDASIRGPLIDEIMVYLVEEQMAAYVQRSDGNFLQALG